MMLLPRHLRGLSHRFAQILQAVLPGHCGMCGGKTLGVEPLCQQCTKALEKPHEPSCPRCAVPYPTCGNVSWECGMCRTSPPSFDTVITAFSYGPHVKTLLMELKERTRTWPARVLAEALVTQLERSHVNIKNFHALVPVPASTVSFSRRLLNPPAVISDKLSPIIKIPVVKHVLLHKGNVSKQSELSFKDRMNNIRGTFIVRNREKVQGKNVFLVDDVVTTTATVRECARELKKAGASQIVVLAGARA